MAATKTIIAPERANQIVFSVGCTSNQIEGALQRMSISNNIHSNLYFENSTTFPRRPNSFIRGDLFLFYVFLQIANGVIYCQL